MNLDQLDEFRRLVTQHFAAFPSATMSEATVSGWWDDLAEIPLASVAYAFDKSRAEAGLVGSEFVPVLPKIKVIAERHAQMAYDAHRRQKLLTAPSTDPQQLPADNPWEQLARYWEQENEHRQQFPSARGEDAGKKRWEQFWRMWAKTSSAGKAAT